MVTMVNETKKFFNIIGLEINNEKSATNSKACMEAAPLLNNPGLKILQDHRKLC
ncbi:hypothetical protein NUSPORA_02927 [Nucleospora cyclopteri]